MTFLFLQALKEDGFDVRRTVGQADSSLCFGGYDLAITVDCDMAAHLDFLRIIPVKTETGYKMVMRLFMKDDVLKVLKLHPRNLVRLSNLAGSFFNFFFLQ